MSLDATFAKGVYFSAATTSLPLVSRWAPVSVMTFSKRSRMASMSKDSMGGRSMAMVDASESSSSESYGPSSGASVAAWAVLVMFAKVTF